MTAIETMKKSLREIQRAQESCVTEHGVVKVWCRERYQILTEKATALKESIDWMESLYAR